MLISLIVLVIVSILAAYFASINLAVIHINLLGLPLAGTSGTLLVVAFGVGVLVGILGMLPMVISRSWAVIRHRRKLQDLQDVMQKKNYGPSDEQSD